MTIGIPDTTSAPGSTSDRQAPGGRVVTATSAPA